MSDPLSVATGVAGVILAAAQISSLLIKFTKSTVAAPQHARVVLTEVSDISGILSHLQSFLLGLDLPDRSRASLLKVEMLVTIISGCVLTFSELEKLLDELKTDDTDNLDILDRLKWARKESALAGLIQRLQNHKISLSLVFDILNGHTIAEAKESVDRLHTLVEKCYSEMSSRVQALEGPNMQQDDACWTLEGNMDSLTPIHTSRPNVSSQEITESGLADFGFSDELQRSRVYRRNQAFRKSVISALTNSVYSLRWSYFSDSSVGGVSNVSVINLAVSEEEVFNPGRVLQTWLAQPNTGYSSDNHMEGQLAPLFKVTHGSVKRNFSRPLAQPVATHIREQSLPQISSLMSRSHSCERHDTHSQWKEHFREEWSTRSAENSDSDSDSDSDLSLAETSDSFSPLETQATSPYSDHQVEDAEAYLCKACGETFEEGKALEASGNRWHIDCFRCITCSKLLNSDSNVLLGDGSLICNACIHSRSVCHVKIEDLVIFTGDQACFKCRDCKKKIENLKYARTSRGIICLNCHGSLTERRRGKVSPKSKEGGQETAQSLLNTQNPFSSILLPLPPEAISKAMTMSSTSRDADLDDFMNFF